MSSSTPPSSAAAPSLSPHQAALQAAEARAKAQSSSIVTPQDAHRHRISPTSTGGVAAVQFDPKEYKASASDKLPFHRVLDTHVLPKCPSKTQAVKTLELMQTIIMNILNPPTPAQSSKYRQLRLSNTQIRNNLIQISSASPIDYLVLCSFRRTTLNFEEYLHYPSSPSVNQLHALKIGANVLDEVLQRTKIVEERENRYRMSEKEVLEERKKKALLAFEEDRRLKMEKDEREKFVRQAKAQQALEQSTKEAERTRLAAQDDATNHPVFSGSTRADRSMIVDTNDDDDDDAIDDDEEGLPSYGSLHGRVLGTGLPVRDDVGFVQNQDLDEDDD